MKSWIQGILFYFFYLFLYILIYLRIKLYNFNPLIWYNFKKIPRGVQLSQVSGHMGFDKIRGGLLVAKGVKLGG